MKTFYSILAAIILATIIITGWVTKPTQSLMGVLTETGTAKKWATANIPNGGENINPVKGKFTFHP